MNVVSARMTAEEFLSLPKTPGKQELLEGEFISLPPAKQRHNAVARRFYEKLQAIIHPARVWYETGFQLESGWLQPDISIIWPDQKLTEWYEGAPMIAIEVVSPGNRDTKIDKKIEAYLDNGGLEVWVVRPEEGTMAVHTRNGVSEQMANYRCEHLRDLINVQALITGHG